METRDNKTHRIKISRREFLKWMGAGTVLTVSGVILDACAPATPAVTPTQASTVVPTKAPVSSASASTTSSASSSVAATSVPTKAAQATIKRGGILKALRQNDWPTMDMHLSQSASPDAPLLFDYLTRFDRNPTTGMFEVKPSLAESWDQQDPTTLVLKLRQGVKFHDGSDLTANVVKWNLERMMTNSKSAAKSQTESIASVEVVDNLTVKLKLKAPSASLLVNLTSEADSAPAIMSQANWEKLGDAGIAQKPVGTGPFKLGEWKAGASVTYQKFDQYWKMGADGKPLPYMDQIVMGLQADMSVAMIQMRSGDCDLVTNIEGKDVPALKSNPNIVYLEYPWQSTIFAVCFNARPGARFAGDNMKKFRQGFLMAIDRQALADVVGAGLGETASSMLVNGQIGYSDKLPKYKYDPTTAKQLIAAAGFPNGLEITLDYISRAEDEQMAQLYQQMLAAVGVKLTLQPSDRVAYSQKTLAGKFDVSIFRLRSRPDPDLAVSYAYAKNGAGNYAGWEDPNVAKALDEGRATYDTAKRQAAYEKAQTIAYEEAYYDFQMSRRSSVAMNKAVKGFESPWFGLFANSPAIWLDR